MKKISYSGRSDDDDDLFDKPKFFEEMHELENGKARHDPPAQMDSTNHDSSASSSRV